MPMQFIKVRFTEWRDAPAPINVKAPVSEADAAAGQLALLAEREAEVRGDIAHAESLLKIANSEQLRERLAGHIMEMDNLYISRKAALAAQASAGEAQMSAMKAHARVGSLGYQVIDEAAMKVLALVDADGAALPAGAVYGYEVIDPNTAPPAWAASFKVPA